MSILRRRRPAEERSYEMFLGPGGQPLISSSFYRLGDVEQALANAASWACINIKADALARSPLDAFRGQGQGVARPVTPPPTLLARPSGIVQPDVWRYQVAWSMVTDGNAFGQITGYTTATYPAAIETLDPCTVKHRKIVNGIAQVEIDNKVHQVYPFGDIWHVPGGMVPAGTAFGLSPIEYAAKTIGTSLSAEDFSYQFFTDGGHPTAIVKSKTNLDEKQASVVKEAIRRAMRSGNREPLVMGADLDWQQIQTNPADSQSLDVLRFEVEQVCRFWGVPPSMIYGAVSGESVTYANVSDADLAFLKHSLDGLYVRLETALTDLLPRPQYVKVNRNAILRADPLARAEYYTKMIATRLMSPNEARALEDMPPITDGTGDKFYGPVAPGKAEPTVPGDAPITVTTPGAKPTSKTPVPVGNGNGSAK